ncbi:MAG: ATPase, partial [Deltaproteobacteria bacterium]|nr:ATPase [Deltaproteobacteria bacterium]
LGPLASKHLQETRRWLANTPDHHWFIQLLATDQTQASEVEYFLKRMTPLLEKEQVKVYVADIKGRNRIGVIYGDFPNKDAAQAAVAQLPPAFKAYRPYPRQVVRLR